MPKGDKHVKGRQTCQRKKHIKGRQACQRGDNHALLTWRCPPPSLVSEFHSHAQLSTRSAEPDLLVGSHSD